MHILGLAEDSKLCHGLVAADDQLHARPQAADQALAAVGVVGAAGGEERPPVVEAYFGRQADRAAPEPPHTMGVSPLEA